MINVQSVWTKKADGTYPDGMKTLKDYGFDAWWVTGVVPAFNRFALMNYKAGEESKALITTNEAAYMNTNGLLRNPDPDIILTTEESQTISETMTGHFIVFIVQRTVIRFVHTAAMAVIIGQNRNIRPMPTAG